MTLLLLRLLLLQLLLLLLVLLLLLLLLVLLLLLLLRLWLQHGTPWHLRFQCLWPLLLFLLRLPLLCWRRIHQRIFSSFVLIMRRQLGLERKLYIQWQS
jgi:hypothetical protein